METTTHLKQTSSVATETDVIQAAPTRAERVGTYGTIHLRHVETGTIILSPKPTDDVNDPLNW